MNIELKYSWSESRIKTLRECLRKYFLNYYLSWEGWKKDAPLEKRQAYILKNMTNLPMWVGSIVHDIIQKIILNLQDGQTISKDHAQNMAIQLLRQGWTQSKNKRWEQDPKRNINLEEHYHNKDISEEKLNEYKEKVLICIDNFYKLPIYQIMLKLKKDDWLSIEEYQSFELRTGEEVSVKLDCGFRYNNKIYLIDWKTGKTNSSVIDQLITYAMYALKQGWTKKLEEVVIVPVFLSVYHLQKEQACPELTVNIKQIERQAQIIRDDSKLLRQAHENRDNIDFFKRTDDPSKCEKCQFRTICPGAVTEIGEGETPF